MTQNTHLLVATARNDGPTILEWVAHHRLCGFDHIRIHHDSSDDTTGQTLRVLSRIGAIDLAAPGTDLPEADWTLELDIADWLCIQAGDGRLADLVTIAPDGAALPRRIFGSAGNTTLKNDLVTERYTACANADSAGAPVHFAPSGTSPDLSSGARINRYTLRDLSSFLTRTDWPAADGATPNLATWRACDLNETTDRTLADRGAALRDEMQRLDNLSNGHLMRLRKRAIRQWRHKAAEMTERDDIVTLREEILTEPDRPVIEGFSKTPFRLPGTQRRTPVFSSIRAGFKEVKSAGKSLAPLILRKA